MGCARTRPRYERQLVTWTVIGALGCSPYASVARLHEPKASPAQANGCPRAASASTEVGRPEEWKSLKLNVVDYSRPFQPLEPGRYVVSVSGDCYAASARFSLPGAEDFRQHGLIDWPVAFEGDELDFVVHETNVTSILVPEHLETVRVRIVRDGVVVLDQTVTMATLCPAVELPAKSKDGQPSYAPGLCIYVQGDEDEPGLCPEGQAQLLFHFVDDESPWESGRAYDLELVQDGVTTTCAFHVPLPMPVPDPEGEGAKPRTSVFSGLDQKPALPDCPLFMDDVREPKGVILTGHPARVTVRVHSEGTSRFEGSAALEYSDTLDYCISGTNIELGPAGAGSR